MRITKETKIKKTGRPASIPQAAPLFSTWIKFIKPFIKSLLSPILGKAIKIKCLLIKSNINMIAKITQASDKDKINLFFNFQPLRQNQIKFIIIQRYKF